LQKAQAELAHVSRLMTLGELTASISHEVNQAIAAIVTSGQVCMRLLALETPRPHDLRATVERIVRDAHRASDVIQRIRALAKRSEPQMVSLDINDVISEAILLMEREAHSHGVSLAGGARVRVAPGARRSGSIAAGDHQPFDQRC
jgi:C4-dicarboxylate-specific signal transduction histidine kinase